MPEVLTLEEMKNRYNNKWLLIAYTEIDEDWNVIKGEVLAHSSDRDDIDAALPLRKGRDVAIEYVGDIPEDYAVLL